MSQVIMITSGKGGVGKSSACVLLGAALGRLGKKVLVLELDSGLRSLDLMMGLQDQVTYDIQDVLLGRVNLSAPSFPVNIVRTSF